MLMLVLIAIRVKNKKKREMDPSENVMHYVKLSRETKEKKNCVS